MKQDFSTMSLIKIPGIFAIIKIEFQRKLRIKTKTKSKIKTDCCYYVIINGIVVKLSIEKLAFIKICTHHFLY